MFSEDIERDQWLETSQIINYCRKNSSYKSLTGS